MILYNQPSNEKAARNPPEYQIVKQTQRDNR